MSPKQTLALEPDQTLGASCKKKKDTIRTQNEMKMNTVESATLRFSLDKYKSRNTAESATLRAGFDRYRSGNRGRRGVIMLDLTSTNRGIEVEEV